ncbi:MAG TPA: site-specific integrase, partial [Desulfuromonadales bacterium]|nr:site-specific integrase [Desulfuromonadales bacterium]
MYSYAVTDLGWCDDNPLAKVHKMKEPRGRTRYLSEDERNRLLAACKTTKNKHLYLIVLLALSTGARQGEIMGLEWRDVELDPQRKRVVLRDTKNGETRAVPLVDRAYELLKEHSKVRRIDTPLVFPGASKSGKDAKPLIIREAWESAVHKAGLENFHFHDLRHTCASYLAMNGATLAEIAEVLGHKTLSMVQRYSHLSEQHVKGVLSKMNDSFLAGVA